MAERAGLTGETQTDWQHQHAAALWVIPHGI